MRFSQESLFGVVRQRRDATFGVSATLAALVAPLLAVAAAVSLTLVLATFPTCAQELLVRFAAGDPTLLSMRRRADFAMGRWWGQRSSGAVSASRSVAPGSGSTSASRSCSPLSSSSGRAPSGWPSCGTAGPGLRALPRFS